jgi:hypothetical protein
MRKWIKSTQELYTLTVEPVNVQGAFSIEQCYDVCLNGKPIKGARYDKQSEAYAEMETMQRLLSYKRAA